MLPRRRGTASEERGRTLRGDDQDDDSEAIRPAITYDQLEEHKKHRGH